MTTKQTKAQLQLEILACNDYINLMQEQLELRDGQIADYHSVLYAVGNALIAIQAKGDNKPLADILQKIGNYCYVLSDDACDEDYHKERVKQLKLIVDGTTREV